MIRIATPDDVERMLEIYAPYIRQTTITFEYEVPSLEMFRERFARISEVYPWLVWEEDGKVLGYAYADRAFARVAYAWDADMSIYLDGSIRARGIGSRLYACLEEMLKSRGYVNLYALVTEENLPSVAFHKKHGYALEGVLQRSGFKFGRWLSVNWFGKRINDPKDPGSVPAPFCENEADREAMCRFG